MHLRKRMQVLAEVRRIRIHMGRGWRRRDGNGAGRVGARDEGMHGLGKLMWVTGWGIHTRRGAGFARAWRRNGV